MSNPSHADENPAPTPDDGSASEPKNPHRAKAAKPTVLASPEEVQQESTQAPLTPPRPAPLVPNMSLDEDEPPFVHAVPEEEIPLAQPVPIGSVPPSEVYEALAVEDDDMLSEEVLEEAPAEPINKAESDVYLAEEMDEAPVAQVPLAPSDVIEVESASDVMDIEDEVLTDDYVPAQPMDSPVWKATPPISGIVQPGEEVEELHPEDEVFALEDAEPAGSSVVHVPPLTGDLLEASSAARSGQQPAQELSEADEEVDLFAHHHEKEAEEPAQEAEQAVEEPVAAEEVFAPTEDVFEPAEEASPASGLVSEEAAESSPSWSSLGEVFSEEPAASAPASEVQPTEEVVFDEAPLAPSSDVQEMLPTESEHGASPSDVAADVLFEEAKAEVMPPSDTADDVLIDEAAAHGPSPSDLAADALFEEATEEAAPASEVAEAEEFVEEDVVEEAPASGVLADEVIFEDEAAEHALEEEAVPVGPSPSDIAANALFDEASAEPAHDSAVAAEEFIDEEIAETAPVSGVAADDVVFDEDEAVHAASPSDVAADALLEEATADDAEEAYAEEWVEEEPASAVVAEDEVESADEVFAAEEVDEEELAEAAPLSEVLDADEVLDDDVVEAEEADLADAEPASAFVEEDLFTEEAAGPGSSVEATQDADSDAVLFDEMLHDSGPPSKPAPSSGTRRKKRVDPTIAFEAPSSATDKPGSFVTDEDLMATSEGSAVNLGDMPVHKGSSISGIDPVAEALESGIGLGAGEKDADRDHPSVEFDEILDEFGTSSGELDLKSAQNKLPPKKRADEEGSTEMDADPYLDEDFALAKPASTPKAKQPAPVEDDVDLVDMFDEPAAAEEVKAEEVAEEIEAEEAEAEEVVAEEEDAISFDEDEIAEAASAVEAEEEMAEAEAEEAVSFDEEEAEAEEAVSFDEEEEAAEAEDADAEAAALLAEEDDAVSFDEEEAAEAEDAEDVEAAEAFDEEETAAVADEEEAEAAEALDDDDMDLLDEEETPRKKATIKPAVGKKPSRFDEEEDETAAEEEEEELVSKKKGKKGSKTIAPPAPAQPSLALRWLGGMFLGTLFLTGGLGAAWYFAPDTVKQLTEHSPNLTPASAPKAPEKSATEKARLAMEQGNYPDAAAVLKDANLPAEVGTRGEAKWLGYYQQQTAKKAPLDRNDPAVKDALADLESAKKADVKSAGLLLAQIDNTLKEQELNDSLVKMKAIEDKTQKDLLDFKTAKEKAEQLVEETKKALVAGKIVDKADDIDLALVAKKLKDLGMKEAALEEVNKLLKDAKIDGAAGEGVKEALKAKKENEDKVAAVNKVLEDEKVKGKDAEGVLEIAKLRTETLKERDDLAATLAAAFKELVDGKIVPMNDDPRKGIVEGVKVARQKAESPLAIPLTQLGMSLGSLGAGTTKVVEQSFDLARALTELGYYRAREPFIQTPEQKLDTYIMQLQDRLHKDSKDLAAVHKEADWVLSAQAKANDEARGKARYVQGLALRNEGKYAEAKAAFAEALKTIEPLAKTGPWSGFAKQAQAELTDPKAYYLPRIEKFRKENNLKAALAEADQAIQAMPEALPLYAERSLVRYDLVHGQGAKIAPEVQQAIKADADAAAKDDKLAAKSAYVQGLLEEELGHLAKAETLFRQAIKSHQGPPDELDAYRIALASLLLRERTEEAPAAPDNDDKKKADKVDADKAGAAIAPVERVIVLHPWTPLVVSAILAAQPDVAELEDAETLKKLKEVTELAQQLIASANPKIKGQGHMLLGQTYAKQGRRTEGLKEVAKGLELLFPGLSTKDLTRMLEEHPAFQQPDVSSNPNPVLAERHFGEGLYYYWSREFALAEAQFKQAVRYNNQYATYQYFLGLAQLPQKTKTKRDAALYAFEQGARLEAKNIPPTRDINLSLERIQGELRQYLNSYRYKAYAVNAEAN